MRSAGISICFFLAAAFLHAQEVNDLLYDAGFENVQVKEEEETLKIFFEHREFRYPFHSMRYAGLLIPEQEKPVEWVPMYHNVPMGIYAEDAGSSFRNLSKEDRAFFKSANELSSGYRFHFRLQPDLSARFGYYTSPFQIKFNLVIDSRIYLARGLSVQTGVLIPVENSLDAQDMKVRLAPSMLHYFSQPINNHFLALSLGTFYFDRYGLDLQYRYADFNKRWSFGFESGLTGFYRLNSGSFYSEPMENLYAVADAEYRLGFQNLSLKLTAGQFLFEDKGARLDLIKQFGTVDFGLYAAATEAGETMGFQFAFSLFPGSIYRNRKLDFRTTEEFRWEYSYNNEQPVARRHRLGIPRLSDNLRQYNVNFMRER